MTDDPTGVDCDVWRDAISARADGTDPGVDERLIEAHLRHCSDCRGFAEAIRQLPTLAPLGVAPDMPDLSRRITKLNAMADRASRWSVVRALLAVVAVEVIVLSLPALVLGEESDSSAHAARHLGAFSVAYGVMLLTVVVRPARARTVLPVAAVLAGALALGAVVDIAQGHVPLVGEALHIPELVSVILVWLLAVPVGNRTMRLPWRRAAPSGLHSVDDEAV